LQIATASFAVPKSVMKTIVGRARVVGGSGFGGFVAQSESSAPARSIAAVNGKPALAFRPKLAHERTDTPFFKL
jgi:hypothetical protein